MKDKKQSLKRSVLNLGVILLISLGCTFFFATGSKTGWNFFLNVLYGVLIGLSIAFGCMVISRLIFNRKNVYENPTKHFVLAILSVTAYIAVDVVFVNYFWFHITQGVSFSDLFSHTFSVFTMTIELVIGLLIYLVALARYFTRDLQSYYVRVAEVESQLVKYQYDTLKNQLNPHFLFNALNTLSGLIYVDVDRADAFIHRLSKLYRYILDVQRVEVVPIQTEMELVSDFLFLNNIRFNDQIQSRIEVDETKGYVVPMALQLLIENAIKHNTTSLASPLKIEIRTEGNAILVRNNLQLKLEKEPSHELGLNNLRERYAVLTDQKVEVEETEHEFTVRIPLLTKEDA